MAKRKNIRQRTPAPKRQSGPARIDLAAIAAALAEEYGLVAKDPRKLRPTDLIRLLNSTPLGEVLTGRLLKRDRDRAGGHIGDAATVDLLRYIAWLVVERHGATTPALAGYEAQRERSRARQADLSQSGRDIGEIPAVAHPDRLERCRLSLKAFCEEYFQKTFHLPWSIDHLKVIAKIEEALLKGGLFALAMPRGSGKTSICEAASLWALLYGHCHYVAIIGPDEDHAKDRIESLRTELENNDRLLEDFPHACYPLRKLEGITQRRLLYHGRVVRQELTAKRLILPELPASPSSGGVVGAAGITGRIRGLNYKLADGTVLRPGFVLIDDPQTEESAASPTQCDLRERTIHGAILGLVGPGERLAAIMPCTVIRAGDLADRLLDRTRNPQWQGERTRMVLAWPTHEDLWEEYQRIRREAQEHHTAEMVAEICNAFYAKRREAMDAGAEVAWPARHNRDELSALQHAWNIRIDRGEAAFFAEYQNEPLPEDLGENDLLSADQIAAKVNGHARGVLPVTASHVTMFIDIQKTLLYYAVVAWSDQFGGDVVEYGTEPDQHSEYFSLRQAKRTLQRAAPRAGLEAAIYAGLERLTTGLLARDWRRDDGALMRIDRCLIDAGWKADVVNQFCRQTPFAGVVMPSHGKGVGASSMPFAEWRRRPGDRVGLNWRVPTISGRRVLRHVLIDTNYWKSFIHARISTPMGDRGCLALYGDKPARHKLLAEHLTSEYRVKTEGRGRTVEEWNPRADKIDNHWFDCIVGCAVAASMQGVNLLETGAPPRRRKRVSLREMAARVR